MIDGGDITMSVYFTADLHLGHTNAIQFTSRPFQSAEEMDKNLITNINSRVLMEDELWILGDFSFKITREQAVEWRKEIRCRHVHLVIGNHDKNYEEQGIFESVQNYKELKTPKGKVILFHYPIADWNGKYHGSLHLHGHIHSTGEYNEKNVESGNRIYDVGVDANDYYPVKLEEIMDKFGM